MDKESIFMRFEERTNIYGLKREDDIGLEREVDIGLSTTYSKDRGRESAANGFGM